MFQSTISLPPGVSLPPGTILMQNEKGQIVFMSRAPAPQNVSIGAIQLVLIFSAAMDEQWQCEAMRADF